MFVAHFEDAPRYLVLGGCEVCARGVRAGEGRSPWEAVESTLEGACVNMSSYSLFNRQELLRTTVPRRDHFPFPIAATAIN